MSCTGDFQKFGSLSVRSSASFFLGFVGQSPLVRSCIGPIHVGFRLQPSKENQKHCDTQQSANAQISNGNPLKRHIVSFQTPALRLQGWAIFQTPPSLTYGIASFHTLPTLTRAP